MPETVPVNLFYQLDGRKLRTYTSVLIFSLGIGLVASTLVGCSSDYTEAEPQAPVVTTVENSVGIAALGYEKLADIPVDTLAYQITYVDLHAGTHVGSWNERASRAALSLIKLYIGHYVFVKGKKQDKDKAYKMITLSDDKAAEELHQEYPDAIEWAAKKYHLDSTVADYRWGYSLTSSYDVAFFLAQLLEEEPDALVLQAMREAAEVAADGTDQDFGTAILPGVIGSKWAWSNEKDAHSSASFGKDFVVVAMVNGDADMLTDLVERQLLRPRDLQHEK